MLELADQLDRIMPTALQGSVVQIVGMTAAVADFPAPVGAVVEIERDTGNPVLAEVIGFRDDLTLLYPYENLQGVRRGNRVRLLRTAALAARRGRIAGARGRCQGRSDRRPAATGAGGSHRVESTTAAADSSGRASTSRWRPAFARSMGC